jgi:hypothetical protein
LDAHDAVGTECFDSTRSGRIKPMRLPYQPFRDHGQLFRARCDRHRADRHSGQQPVQSRSSRVGRVSAARDRRGLRESGRVPGDRPIRLCDGRCDPNRWRTCARVGICPVSPVPQSPKMVHNRVQDSGRRGRQRRRNPRVRNEEREGCALPLSCAPVQAGGI